ncbi:MAG: TCR/Tet family MFS transporter [Gammaproteobacteria bacterium]|nr:TCR/Tet family MFS transporter [Gammaproteobacteria bacterium]
MNAPIDPRRRMLPVVAMALFIDSLGIGIIIPVAPKLVMELSGLGLADAAPIAGWLTLAYASMQFIFSPVLGNLSDRYGRKPILLASLAALAVDYVLMGLAPSLLWLFAGRIIAGIAGATFATANAVVADIIPPDQRARYFGLNGAAWGMGFIVGPVVGGLLGQYGSRVPFFAAAVFTALNFLIAVAVLRETLPAGERRSFSARRANVLGALRSMRAIPGALLLLFVLFMYQIGHDTLPSTWAWMTMEKFGWGERDVGISLAVLGLGTAVVQGGLVGLFTRRLGEHRSALIGLAGGAVGFLGYALATTPWMLFASVPLACLIGLTMPSIRAILSRQVPANAQGELQGAIAGIVSFTAIVTPFTMTHLFSVATSSLHFPGAPFVAAAVSLLLGALVFSRVAGPIAPAAK